MEAANDCEEKLISLIMEHKFLYDKEEPAYKDINKKNGAWKSIAKEMELTRTECEALWNKVRDQYTAYLRKQRSNSKSSSKKQLFFRHNELMSFYHPYYKPYKTVNQVTMKVEKNEKFEKEDSCCSYNSSQREGSPLSVNFVDSDTAADELQNGFNDDAIDAVENSSYSKIELSNSPKRKIAPVGDIWEASKKFQKASVGKEMDEFELFCFSLVPKLRRIYKKSPKNAAIAQVKIQELLIPLEYD